MSRTVWKLAVVGAGPAGLALALQAARLLPHVEITLFDSRALSHDVAGDPRTLALSLGSLQFLGHLGLWDDARTGRPRQAPEPILEVQVSQAGAGWTAPGAPAEVTLRAADLGVAQLGAVLGYGALVAPLQQRWMALSQAQPERLHSCFGTPVAALKPLPSGVEVDAGVAQAFDLAVVAEGGVFAQQARKALTRDYGQTAWVGTAELDGGTRGVAVERFTRQGPLALLPLAPADDGARRAALVWCVDSRDDPVRPLDAAQRLAVLNSLLPAAVGRLRSLSPLKDFALGLNAERTLVQGGPDGQGRVVRIGNAAQTLHPVAGQGLNLGLRDVHELVARLRWTDDLDAALRQVEWARAPDRWSMIATTDFLARSFTWQWPGVAAVRGLALAMLQATPPAKAWLARHMMFGSR